MRALARATTTLALLAASTVTLSLPAAGSTGFAADGQRCTIVGTRHADTLRGTDGRDVICSRGGNDVVYGRGGDDVIDVGDGDDRVYAGGGKDAVFGGTGRDSVTAGGGSDVVRGGAGADTVAGGDGADDVAGGLGADTLSGGAGVDEVSGGDGSDVETGGGGTDDVTGGLGDDELDGNSGPDSLNGGDGYNICTLDPADVVHRRCVYDLQPAQLLDVSLSADTVDVTDSAAEVVVRMHVTDDTGVMQVQGYEMAERISGIERDGWWESVITIPRYTREQVIDIDVWMTDRIGRQSGAEHVATLTVVDDNPDTSPPVVTSTTVSATKIDVRTASKTVTVTARITDDLSGVRDFVWGCLDKPSSESLSRYVSGPCVKMALQSGTRRDGIWKGTVTVAEGSVGGDWNALIEVGDRANTDRNDAWAGPDEYQYYSCADGGLCLSGWHPLPGGVGRVQVVGGDDPAPPVLVTATVTPREVDTLEHGASATVDIHATDTDVDGLDNVTVDVIAGDTSIGPGQIMTQLVGLVDGDSHDGIWRVSVTFPQGMPPGNYYLFIRLTDMGHYRAFVPPGSPYAGQDGIATMTSAQGDGTIVVVSNPAA